MDYEIENKHHGVAEKPNIWTQDLPIVTTIHPPLAKEIGLNESIVLRQIAFWLNTSNNFRDGEWWTYQSLEDMKKKAFPYWSVATISRTINNLCEVSLIKKTDIYNKRKNDRTQWFSLNIEGLNKLTSIKVVFQNAKWILQDEKTILQDETTLPEYNPIKESINKDSNPVLDELALVVKKELKQTLAIATRIASYMLGLSKGKDKELNLDTPMSKEDFLSMMAWWDLKKDRDGQKLARPSNLMSFRRQALQWQSENKKPLSLVQSVNGIAEPITPSQSVSASQAMSNLLENL